MTYSPHTWQPGEIISSARLNALEQGVAAGGGGGGGNTLCVLFAYDDNEGAWTVSETIADMLTASASGTIVYGVIEEEYDGALDSVEIYQMISADSDKAWFQRIFVELVDDSIQVQKIRVSDSGDVEFDNKTYDLSNLVSFLI